MKVKCPNCESENIELLDCLDFCDDCERNNYFCNDCECDFMADVIFERNIVGYNCFNIKIKE